MPAKSASESELPGEMAASRPAVFTWAQYAAMRPLPHGYYVKLGPAAHARRGGPVVNPMTAIHAQDTWYGITGMTTNFRPSSKLCTIRR